ncbi:MAG: hypothetical protein IT260_21235 [Saprospiraceae bacterium]|nr:hypothetical protein [Saprospiraceae bacterium]
MEKGYLPELLQSLTPAERLALRKYLCSPYHNTRADVLALFDHLSQKNAAPVDRSASFGAVFREKPFDARQMNYTVSYLSKLVEGFLAQREWEADTETQDLYLFRQLRKRRLGRLSERAAHTAEKRRDKQARRDAAYFRQGYALAFEQLRAHLQQGRARDIDFDSLTEAHEKAFVYEKLKLGCMLQSRQAVGSRAYGEGLLPVVLEFLQEHPWLREPALAAWYHGYFVQLDPQATQNFEQLKDLIFRHGRLLPDDERHDLFLLAINFCIRRINSGDAVFSKDLFDLYQEGLVQHIFLENGVMSRWSYNNIVNTALKMGEVEWSLQFLEDYRQRLEPAFRDTSYFFNLARCQYEKGDLSAALASLTRIEYDDILQNLSAKTLQLKIYYAPAAGQPLDSLLDSVAVYLRRKKILGYHRENFSNILRFLQRLIALPPGNSAALALLRQELEQCKVLSEKAWFLQKLSRSGSRRTKSGL